MIPLAKIFVRLNWKLSFGRVGLMDSNFDFRYFLEPCNHYSWKYHGEYRVYSRIFDKINYLLISSHHSILNRHRDFESKKCEDVIFEYLNRSEMIIPVLSMLQMSNQLVIVSEISCFVNFSHFVIKISSLLHYMKTVTDRVT